MKVCDYEGHEFYPQYGVGPHTHDIAGAGGIIGSTRLFTKKDWPKNYTEDPECEGCGTYVCPECLGNGVVE